MEDKMNDRFIKQINQAFEGKELVTKEYQWADWYWFDLGTARTKELISIPDIGNCICRAILTGEVHIRLNNPQANKIPLRKIPRLYGVPFKRLFLTNDAQSGKELLLLIGWGDYNIGDSPDYTHHRDFYIETHAETILADNLWYVGTGYEYVIKDKLTVEGKIVVKGKLITEKIY